MNDLSKKILILTGMLFSIVNLQAQDYLISFGGSGASTTVDSVKVKNPALGINLTLAGTDVLNLVSPVGIGQTDQNGDFLKVCPNPVTDESYLEFSTLHDGFVMVELFDAQGALACQSGNNLKAGCCRYAVCGLNRGLYTLRVRSNDVFHTRKLVSAGTSQGNPTINYLGGNAGSPLKNELKSRHSIVHMPFNDGNQLIFTFWSGTFSAVIPLMPTQSQTVVANFVPCTDAGGRSYPTLTIVTGKKSGTGVYSEQIWMAENLDVGTRIDGMADQTDNTILEKYCFGDLDTNCSLYGGLYQWNEMMQYDTTEGVQGICPDGWHLPTTAEWTTLTDLLGGMAVAGGKLKATGTIEAGTGLWPEPNGGATNSSGFTALPGGYRADVGGYYDSIDAYFWVGSQLNSNVSWVLMLQACCEHAELYGDGVKTAGASVRCILD